MEFPRACDLEAELRELAATVREGAEERPQMDLTFPQAEAARAPAEVGAAACTCEGGPEAEVKDPACPTHGVETRGENRAVDASMGRGGCARGRRTLRCARRLRPPRIACDDEGGLRMACEAQAVDISISPVALGARRLGRREP